MTTHTVCQYSFIVDDEVELMLPRGAQILHINEQGHMHDGMGQLKLQCWALVNPSNSVVPRKIRIHGTGHPIKKAESLRYINTFQLFEGRLVFHAFEVIG